MTDHSHLDSKYFIDNHVFNCPFCNRNNVSYYLDRSLEFDWSNNKKCYVHFARCTSCEKKSMNLSFDEINLNHMFASSYRFYSEIGENIDEKFFYSVPTSFFTLDTRIPKILRELFSEAEGCLKSNYLTGASVCARKLIYELAIIEGAVADNYDERIKSLKQIRQDVEGEYFDTLLTIQQLTSDKVHEESYDGWQSKHLKLMLSAINEILGMMYVIPALRDEKRKAILQLKDDLVGKSA
jgi:transcription elongation factor Elf1